MLISGINAIKMALMTICKPEQDKKRYFSFLKDGTDSCEYRQRCSLKISILQHKY